MMDTDKKYRLNRRIAVKGLLKKPAPFNGVRFIGDMDNDDMK